MEGEVLPRLQVILAGTVCLTLGCPGLGLCVAWWLSAGHFQGDLGQWRPPAPSTCLNHVTAWTVARAGEFWGRSQRGDAREEKRDMGGKRPDGLRGGVTTCLGSTWAEHIRHLGVKCRTETLSSWGAGGVG